MENPGNISVKEIDMVHEIEDLTKRLSDTKEVIQSDSTDMGATKAILSAEIPELTSRP